MIPIDPRAWAVIGLSLALAAALGVAGVQTVRLAGAEAAHSATKAKHADVLRGISDLTTKAAQAVAADQAANQKKLAQIDEERTKEKTHAITENDRLRRAVVDGTRRLRIAASCPARGGDVPAPASAAGMDAPATVELAPEAGQAVLDLRADLIAERAALIGLQGYVRELCLSP